MNVLLFILICFGGCLSDSGFYKTTYSNSLVSSNRIIGGNVATRHQFPYQVSIQWGLILIYSHICGGTIISENWVLTAAHCKAFSVGNYQVVLGQLRQNELHQDIQRIFVDEFVVHSKYYGGVSSNDIALIRLSTPAKISSAVQIASLPSKIDCDAIEDTLLSGWGLTSWFPTSPITLQWIRLPRITNQDCASNLTALLQTSEPLDDTMLCTGSYTGKGQSACSGDSGGPLIRQTTKKLIGITSWGISPCGVQGAPTVYTRVCSHLDFINYYINRRYL